MAKKLMSNIYDCTFKTIVLDSKLKKFICTIIHEITHIPMHELLNGVFINSTITINHISDKRRVSDIILKTAKHIINIEANKDYYPGLFIKNNSYYQSILSNLYETSEDYLKVLTAIQINIDNFSLSNVYPCKKISKYVLKEETDNTEFIENDVIKYYVDLVTLEKISRQNKFNNLSKLDKYLLVFKLRNISKIKELAGDDEEMKKVVKKIMDMNSDEKLIGVYDKEKQDRMILNTRLTGARMEGEKIGYQKGEKSGYTKGLFDTARNLLLQNIPIDVISKTTGLSKNKIKSLNISR